MTGSKTLVLSKRYSDDSRLLAEAAHLRRWTVERLQSSNVPPHLVGRSCRVYAEGFLVEHLASQLGLILIRPADDLLVRYGPEFLAREVEFCRVEEFKALTTAKFVKPADQKLFPAGVYSSEKPVVGLNLLQPYDPLLISEVVAFTHEYRFFVCHGEVLTGSVYWAEGQSPQVAVGYEGEGDPLWPDALAFARRVCAAPIPLPQSVVLDVGRLTTNQWAIIEFNPTWASGLYGSAPERVLDCLDASQLPEERNTPHG